MIQSLSDIIGFVPIEDETGTLPAVSAPAVAGRSLIDWAVKALLESQYISPVYISDSQQLQQGFDRAVTHIEAGRLDAFLRTQVAAEAKRIAVLTPGYPLFSGQAVDACLTAGADAFCAGPFSVAPPSEFPIKRVLTGAEMDSAWTLFAMTPLGRRVVETYLATAPERFGADVVSRAKRVRLLALDVDGVLTDAGMYFDAAGEALKKFNTRDGMGIRLIRDHLNIDVIWITGENSPRVAARAKKLQISHVFPGVREKRNVLADYCDAHGLSLDEVAYMGDDRNDADVMCHVGLACAPADAYRECLNAAHFISRYPGGHGCVRELCEFLLDLHGFDGHTAPPPVNV